MKPSKPGKGDNNADMTELMMKVIDLQSRVIEALAMALGAKADAAKDDEDDDEEGEEDEEK